MRILVTGGPVHAHLDAVKVITNRFKGSRMLELAAELWYRDVEITYLKSDIVPLPALPGSGSPPIVPKDGNGFQVVTHSGFEDYRSKVLDMAPNFNAVILGAAVANLIPLHPLEGKFPSHDYAPGDVIPIEFQIAPRIIDAVKEVAPKTHLFGFKLLSGAAHDELIRAAYEIVLASKATAVFANDATNLDVKYAVFKDRSVHEWHAKNMAGRIRKLVSDEYYRTINQAEDPPVGAELMNVMIERFYTRFKIVETGLMFGTVAVRAPRNPEAFFTTVRGKQELDGRTYVADVDHEKRLVYSSRTKPTLNAPLLHRIFTQLPDVHAIVHYHEQEPGLPELPYAPPGTRRDADRLVASSFNIEQHGCFLLFDGDGNRYSR